MKNTSFRKITFDISSEVQHMAKLEELGELRKIYTFSKQNHPLFLLGILFALCGVIITIRIFLQVPSPLGVELAGVVLLLTGCYLLFARKIYSHWHIYLWQHGFLYEKGQMREVFHWDQIETIQCICTAQTQSSWKVCRRDGYKVNLSSTFSLDFLEMIDVMLTEVFRQLAPQKLSIPPARSIQIFTSDLKIDQQGIGNAKERLSWQEIQEFRTHNGLISLLKQAE